MKKKTIVLTIVLIVCVCIFAGAVYLFNDIFPKAAPIRHPEIEDVVSVSLSSNTPDEPVPMDGPGMEDLLLYISDAKPTRKQSVNDYPTSGTYYRIEMQTENEHYRYFVYEEHGQVYIELPYEGIYTSDEELLDLLRSSI